MGNSPSQTDFHPPPSHQEEGASVPLASRSLEGGGNERNVVARRKGRTPAYQPAPSAVSLDHTLFDKGGPSSSSLSLSSNLKVDGTFPPTPPRNVNDEQVPLVNRGALSPSSQLPCPPQIQAIKEDPSAHFRLDISSSGKTGDTAAAFEKLANICSKVQENDATETGYEIRDEPDILTHYQCNDNRDDHNDAPKKPIHHQPNDTVPLADNETVKAEPDCPDVPAIIVQKTDVDFPYCASTFTTSNNPSVCNSPLVPKGDCDTTAASIMVDACNSVVTCNEGETTNLSSSEFVAGLNHPSTIPPLEEDIPVLIFSTDTNHRHSFHHHRHAHATDAKARRSHSPCQEQELRQAAIISDKPCGSAPFTAIILSENSFDKDNLQQHFEEKAESEAQCHEHAMLSNNLNAVENGTKEELQKTCFRSAAGVDEGVKRKFISVIQIANSDDDKNQIDREQETDLGDNSNSRVPVRTNSTEPLASTSTCDANSLGENTLESDQKRQVSLPSHETSPKSTTPNNLETCIVLGISETRLERKNLIQEETSSPVESALTKSRPRLWSERNKSKQVETSEDSNKPTPPLPRPRLSRPSPSPRPRPKLVQSTSLDEFEAMEAQFSVRDLEMPSIAENNIDINQNVDQVKAMSKSSAVLIPIPAPTRKSQGNSFQTAEQYEKEHKLKRIISEYEKTLAIYAEKMDELKQKLEMSNEEKGSFIKDRDQALEDLNNVESAFSDLHKKYERSKSIIMNLKENEAAMVKRDQELNQRIENREKKLEMYKQTAQEKVEQMYQDYEQKLKDVDAENTRLRAQNRLIEMKLSTLANDAEQKAKENLQLRALCDELINGQTQGTAT